MLPSFSALLVLLPKAGIKPAQTALVSYEFPANPAQSLRHILPPPPKDLSFPVQFGISTEGGAPNAAPNSWIVGVVNAAPYLASAAWYVLYNAIVLCRAL